jgi:hypothetical protein
MADELDSAPSAPSPTPSPSEPSSTPAPSAPAASEAAPSSTPPSEPTAEPSGKSSKETLLDAVLKVVPATTEDDVLKLPQDAATPESPDKTTPEDGQAEATGPDDDDDTEPAADAASPIIREKINKLLKQRRELRQEVETLKPAAEIGGQLETFAKTNDLSGDDVVSVLQMAAFLRHGDYESFYKAVAPFVRTAQEYLGLTLPKDLRDRVQQGHMTEETAKEFARQRMDTERLNESRTAEQRQAAQTTLRLTQDQVNRSVTALEGQLAASDPDYRAKAASVRRTAQAILFERGGTIKTVDEALAITREAYAEVNATIRKQRTPPQPTARMPNGNGQSRSARAEPNSLMEAALAGLAAARNGTGHP